MSEILEGTPEFNRGFQLNGAAMEPVLDGQVYAPAPQLIDDDHVGFDMNGNYHAIPSALEAVAKTITPYRWAHYLQDALTQYCSTFDYTVGLSERDDIVQDIVTDRMERALNQEEVQELDDALTIWRSVYNPQNEGA
jgi:hypothetical protein